VNRNRAKQFEDARDKQRRLFWFMFSKDLMIACSRRNIVFSETRLGACSFIKALKRGAMIVRFICRTTKGMRNEMFGCGV